MDKKLEEKITYLVYWFIPLAILFFCFYQFVVKPNIWYFIISCISSVALGWLLSKYLEV